MTPKRLLSIGLVRPGQLLRDPGAAHDGRTNGSQRVAWTRYQAVGPECSARSGGADALDSEVHNREVVDVRCVLVARLLCQGAVGHLGDMSTATVMCDMQESDVRVIAMTGSRPAR